MLNIINKNTSNILPQYAKDHCYLSNNGGGKDSHIVSVIMLYHNECDLLYFQTFIWRNLPLNLLKRIRFIIIDDHSMIPACNCIYNNVSSNQLSSVIDIIRITKPNKWNISGGRNIGALLSCTEYLFVCDLDMYISKIILHKAVSIIELEKNQSSVIQLNRILIKGEKYINTTSKPHPGMMIIPRDVYWDIDGCDEDLVGNYGFTDVLFKWKAHKKGYPIKIYDEVILIPIDNRYPKSYLIEKIVPPMDRSIHHNKMLFHNKTSSHSLSGYTSSNNGTVVRFNWYIGCDVLSNENITITDNIVQIIADIKINAVEYYYNSVFTKVIENEHNILLANILNNTSEKRELFSNSCDKVISFEYNNLIFIIILLILLCF